MNHESGCSANRAREDRVTLVDGGGIKWGRISTLRLWGNTDTIRLVLLVSVYPNSESEEIIML